MLPNLKQLIMMIALILLSLILLMMVGGLDQDSIPPNPTKNRPLAQCTDCYYHAPSITAIEQAEQHWQAEWGRMSAQELANGAVLEH